MSRGLNVAGVDSAEAMVLANEPVRVGANAGVLESVLWPGTDLAIWQRTEVACRTWLDDLPSDALPTCRMTLLASEAARRLHAVCDASGTAAHAMRDAWVVDVASLVSVFARLTESATVLMRLEVVSGNGCRRWHRDCVPLRLICTFRGPGTMWMPPPLGPWALAHADDDLAQHARAFGTGDVALFKGCGWAGHTHDHGIVHRSPRIEGTGQTRLVMVLDPISSTGSG